MPTRDVARSSCVSRLWRDSARDPSFRSLHGKASHVIGGAAETLLVSEKRKHGCNDEAGVFHVSSGKLLRRVPIIGGYVLANVCNSFLCFADGKHGQKDMAAAVLVCNPATGEMVKLPDPPPVRYQYKTHLFALGFSPPTKPTNEYKLLRLSCSRFMRAFDIDVYTLGGSTGEWRNRWYSSECYPTAIWAPVLIDGKLYVATLPWNDCPRYQRIHNPQRVLVVDVYTEKCHTYHLPSYVTYQSDDDDRPPVSAFELSGRLCFAVHTGEGMQFWVMSLQAPPPEEANDYDIHGEPRWDLCYRFHMEEYISSGLPCAGWLSDSGMLCYMQASTLHKYDTRGQRPLALNYNDILRWEQQVDLSTTPLLPVCQWPNIYGGYRPTLLSPLTLRSQDDVNDENRYELEHAMSSKLSDASSKPNISPQLMDPTN